MAGTKPVMVPSGATFEVGAIDWKHYIKLKQQIVELMSGPVVTAIIEALPTGRIVKLLNSFASTDQKGGDPGESWSNDDSIGFVAEFLASAKSTIPAVLPQLNKSLDELESTLVHGCVRGDVPDEMDVFDRLELRNQALECSRFSELLEREKNWLEGVVRALRIKIGTKTTTPSGTSDGNQS